MEPVGVATFFLGKIAWRRSPGPNNLPATTMRDDRARNTMLVVIRTSCPATSKVIRQRPQNFLGQDRRMRRVLQPRHQDDELVAPKTGDRVGFTHKPTPLGEDF